MCVGFERELGRKSPAGRRRHNSTERYMSCENAGTTLRHGQQGPKAAGETPAPQETGPRRRAQNTRCLASMWSTHGREA